MRWESKVPLGRYLPTCIIQPTKTTRNFSVFCLSKTPTTTFHARINFLNFLFSKFLFPKFLFSKFLFSKSLFLKFLFSKFQVLPKVQVPIYLFPLSRILRSLSQSIRTILHSTRQTLESISYCFGTSGIYSTFYISIDFFCILFLVIFLGVL